MANRAMAMRYISRRFSKGSRILSEEERAAENVYIQVIGSRLECICYLPYD